jgi:hypothetical protein
MKTQELHTFPAALRFALAIVEFVLASLLLMLGIICSIDTPGRGSSDGIGKGIAEMMALPFILYGLGIAVAAVTAWIGGRRWWIWQIVILTLEVVLPVALIIVFGIFSIFLIDAA